MEATTAFDTLDGVVGQITRLHHSQMVRPTLEDVEAAEALAHAANREERARLNVAEALRRSPLVPKELVYVAQEMHRTLAGFQCLEQRDATRILELDALHALFDDLIQRASQCVPSTSTGAEPRITSTAAAAGSQGWAEAAPLSRLILMYSGLSNNSLKVQGLMEQKVEIPENETKRVIQRFGKAFTKGRPVRDLFDADIANKSNTKVLEAIGAIANKCLNEEYDARPEMNDVAGRLRDLRAVLESGQGTGWRFFNGGQNELKTEKPGVAWSSIFSRNTTIFKKGYPAPAGIPRYSYGDLKMMTKNFTDVLGRGAYCTVYRGHLPDGRAVAVKQLYGVGGSEVEFWSEVTIMARMNHRNIVSIWGWCADKGQRMLILEFISNGSLDKHVLPASTQEDDGPDQRQQLDLNTRHQIALGVAHAMAYMHEECSDGVLHCDIKPHNILLDDNFCPKLTDFGLSTWLNKTMSRVRGTRGYMAPEWVIHREVITAKADVYSFGMVLLEVVSGRNYNFREESVGSEDWYFPKWVYEKCYIHHKIEDILDPILQAEACQGTGIAELMVNTAIWCLQDRAEKRPSMGKVVKMLDGTIEMTKQPEKPVIFCACDD
ncbi:hypothetical protein ZWY2020_045142 [Hordeum vulgare]|nr:hypothetical protein ZWY2020_045142 [Hordeum vulgare]